MRLRPARCCLVSTALYLVIALGNLPALAEPEVLPDPACAYRLLHSFGKPGPGAMPRATLLQGSDGALYGTAQHGGANDFGTVFKVKPDGTGFQVLVHFDRATNGMYPWAGVIQGSDGWIYGTAPLGGAHGMGTAFKVKIDGTGFTVLKSFSGADTGSYPYGALLQGADGALYGTASEGGTNGTGTIFKMNTDGSGFTVLKNFAEATTGAYPFSELIQAPDGTLYGTASGGGAGFGTVFKIKIDGTGFTVVKNFQGGAGGGGPWTAVLRASNGSLYGTSGGGLYDGGTIYRVNTDGSGFAVLAQFQYVPTGAGAYPLNALIEGPGGVLYGTTSDGGAGYGTVFKIGLDGTGFAPVKPLLYYSPLGATDRTGGVILGADGALYGTTPEEVGSGSVYRVNTDGTNFVTLFTGFSLLPDISDGGGLIGAGVIQGTDGVLYGVTARGGTTDGGTVFRLRPDGTGFTVVKNLDVSTGIQPAGELIQAADGALYGTASLLPSFGSFGAGTIFRLNPDGSGFSVILSFQDITMGANPRGVIQGTDGKLYGTTGEGGLNLRGTVFRVDTDGSNFTVLKDLGSMGVSHPSVGVIQGTDGRLYGTALGSPGAVFRLSPDGSGFSIVRQLGTSAGLTEGPNGVLYGLTAAGGSGGGGTVFRMNRDGTGYSGLHDFDFSGSGSTPSGELVLAADGKLYGTTQSGGSDNVGTFFSLNPDGTGFTSIMSFDRALHGQGPAGRLIQGNDGLIYGTQGRGGSAGGGGVFRFDPFVNHTAPVARCKDVTIPSTSACTAAASINDGSFDPDAGDRIELSQAPAGPFPVGDTLVTLSVTDRGCATSVCTATVTVLPGTPCDDGNACTMSDQCEVSGCVGGAPLNCDDGDCCTVDSCDPGSGCEHAPNAAPPTIVVQPDLDGGGGSCPALWPPNHHYVDFGVADTGIEAVSACGGVTYAFASCGSSQAEDQPGGSDGTTVRDCVYEPGALHLRAERDGTCSPKGRSYTMTMIAIDACGNLATSSPFTACVWHDKQNAPDSQGNIYGAAAGSGGNDPRSGTNGTYGAACGPGCGLVCGESGQTHDSSDDDRPSLALTPLTGGGVRLDWSLPAPGDPYPPNANYEVWRRVRGQTLYEKLIELPHSVTTYTDAATADGVDYEWSVNALY
jgi:uncharacterized repeat protein (TIGR03803 family)